jgi:nitrogen fixation-related uncharacterized protein
MVADHSLRFDDLEGAGCRILMDEQKTAASKPEILPPSDGHGEKRSQEI